MTRQIRHIRRSKKGKLFAAGKEKPFKIIRKEYERFVMSNDAAMSWAKFILRNKPNRTILFLGFWNGMDAFVKEHNKVRVSTKEEYEKYMLELGERPRKTLVEERVPDFNMFSGDEEEIQGRKRMQKWFDSMMKGFKKVRESSGEAGISSVWQKGDKYRLVTEVWGTTTIYNISKEEAAPSENEDDDDYEDDEE